MSWEDRFDSLAVMVLFCSSLALFGLICMIKAMGW